MRGWRTTLGWYDSDARGAANQHCPVQSGRSVRQSGSVAGFVSPSANACSVRRALVASRSETKLGRLEQGCQRGKERTRSGADVKNPESRRWRKERVVRARGRLNLGERSATARIQEADVPRRIVSLVDALPAVVPRLCLGHSITFLGRHAFYCVRRALMRHPQNTSRSRAATTLPL